MNEITAELNLQANNLAFGGDFVCEVTEDQSSDLKGIKVFVPFVLPQEQFVGKITKRAERFLKAEKVNIMQKHPQRTKASCEYFETCGGCSLQHASYDLQLALKAQMIINAFQFEASIALNPEEQLSVIATKAYAYRNRIKLQVSKRGEIGFFKRDSDEIVNILHCPISSALINQALPALAKISSASLKLFSNIFVVEQQAALTLIFELRQHKKLGDRCYQELKSLFNQALPLRDLDIMQGDNIASKISDSDLEVLEPYPAGHFTQVNDLGNEALKKIILAEACKFKNVQELYAGAGNFSIPLAQAGLQATAVELDAELVKYGQAQANKQNLNITWHQQSCEKYLEQHPLAELVVADPPRAGLASIRQHFDNSTTKKLIYISCSLPHLTRDLKELVSLGYKLRHCYFVDMFPQTHHVEIVAILER